MNGSNVSVSITFTTNKSPTGTSPNDLYIIVAAVVAIAVIGSAVALMRKRR